MPPIFPFFILRDKDILRHRDHVPAELQQFLGSIHFGLFRQITFDDLQHMKLAHLYRKTLKFSK